MLYFTTIQIPKNDHPMMKRVSRDLMKNVMAGEIVGWGFPSVQHRGPQEMQERRFGGCTVPRRGFDPTDWEGLRVAPEICKLLRVPGNYQGFLKGGELGPTGVSDVSMGLA
jgi:hypothetical protein